MGNAQHDHDTTHGDSHEGPIKTPKQLIWAVVAGFVVPIILAIMLANYVASGARPSAGTQSQDAENVARRIQPVGTVDFKDANAPTVLKTGEQVYAAQCAACHTSGAAGAPKLADAAAWGPRLKTGFEALVQSAMKGKGAMAAQAGGDHSDIEIARAVAYIANQAGGKFEEPKAPAAPAAAPAASAAAK